MASASSLVPVLSSAKTRPNHFKRSSKNVSPSKKPKPSKDGGGLGNVVEVVQKDVAFLKAGLSKGLQWANKAFRVPEVSKSMEDLIWLRGVEDSRAESIQFPSWPQPYYPELSGVDLFMADTKAMEVYFGYFYYLSKMWTKPLPEIYDADKVTEYFTLRPHVVALRLLEALSELHDQIPPFPRAEAMKIIEEELGSPVKTFFSYVAEEPVAAASFGQLQLLQKIAKRENDLRPYADELGKGLTGELDYNLEAANALEFMEVHSHFKFISSPKVFRHLTNKRVLTMEWMVGDSPSELISVSSQESNRKLLDLVNKGVEASLVQLLETGLMHADPHPGNLRYTSSGKIGFLDFGLLCRMEKKHQLAMLASIVHIVNGDWASLVYDLTEMDVVLSKIWSVALKYHCRMPPYYILVLRSLASLEALVSNEASPLRQQICKIVADILYQWMSEALRKGPHLSKFSSPAVVTGAHNPQTSSTGNEYETLLRDRRLRVIFFKALNSAKKDPVLLFRSFWASFVIFFMALAMACHRVLVSLTGDYMSRLSYNSKKIAATA
ncbi:uncharacterized aarf domain-containing protein kinase at1g79600 chloroplastic [Phtheirospermum japonicum]|uniref:Uncharacterized aarf domain-containing protein kinase at1g79600 chloroplastic n=1 Tax=Phtheirospermum japonicum TaxID=374723 RepID=A0A830BCK5_9LAMI|nr:uncharacterized aarf domain-containing protein kinase at1g79600 chloroplastic [Phtheirospermum japonicum]